MVNTLTKPQALLSLEDYYLSLLQEEKGILSSSIATEAKKRFKQYGLPTNRHEEWKYTSLDNLYKAKPLLNNEAKINYGNENLPLKHTADMIIVSVAKQTIIGNVPTGLSIDFTNNNQAIEQLNARFNEVLPEDPMFSLNQALCHRVITVNITKNTVIEAPIVIDYGNDVESSYQTQNAILKSVQVVVSLEQSAQATLLECHRNLTGEKELSIIACAFNLAQNAQCQHYSVSNQQMENQHFWYGYGSVGRDAHLQSNSLVAGEQLARRFFCNDLNGEGAEVTVNSAYQAKETQTLDIRTFTRHLKPNCQSMQLHQGLLDDRSTGVFNGMIYVDPVALKTDGQMDNNVMLLTPQAQNNSKPQLEIYADDVKCSHGFTCGSIDKNQLYYMRSRGIPEALARKQILKAFIARVTENFPSYINV
jgi:Fe-S cluster assembly protein SufD